MASVRMTRIRPSADLIHEAGDTAIMFHCTSTAELYDRGI
jgi:hypothetical protein